MQTQSKVLVPALLAVLLGAAYVGLQRATGLAPGAGSLLWIGAAALAAAGVAVVRLVSHGLFAAVFRRRKGREPPALLRVTISVAGYILVIGAIYTWWLERDPTEVLATSAVLTVILGLALQDTLGNFFSGVSIHVEQPYHIGDAILVEGNLGRVISVTWRTTTLRTNDNSTIILPNNQIARQAVEIFELKALNRRIVDFPAPLSMPPRRLASHIEEAVATLPGVAAARRPEMRMRAFGDAWIQYEVLYWLRDYMDGFEMDARVRQRIWYVLNREGIPLPYPVTELARHEEFTPPLPGAQSEGQRILRSVELFEPLSGEELQVLAAGAIRHLFGPGERILRQGDPGESMFVVARGEVEVRLRAEGAAPRTVASLGEGSFFGEMALFTGEARTADVVAVSEVVLLEIRKGTVAGLLEANERLAEAFSSKIADRQAGLAAHRQAGSAAAVQEQRRSILARIRAFFRHE